MPARTGGGGDLLNYCTTNTDSFREYRWVMQFGRLDISDLCTSFCGGRRGEGISGTIVCMIHHCRPCKSALLQLPSCMYFRREESEATCMYSVCLYHPLTSWPHTHTQCTVPCWGHRRVGVWKYATHLS